MRTSSWWGKWTTSKHLPLGPKSKYSMHLSAKTHFLHVQTWQMRCGQKTYCKWWNRWDLWCLRIRQNLPLPQDGQFGASSVGMCSHLYRYDQLCQQREHELGSQRKSNQLNLGLSYMFYRTLLARQSQTKRLSRFNKLWVGSEWSRFLTLKNSLWSSRWSWLRRNESRWRST